MASIANRIALVTGGNKGIGYAIVKSLSDHKELHVLLGARDESKGQQAVEQLKQEKTAQGQWYDNVSPFVVDVDDEKSIHSAAERVKTTYGGLDILVNNAGMAFKGDAFDENVARTTFKTNYTGTLLMCQSFLPLIRDHGRVVNISSMTSRSTLRKLSPELQKQFLRDNLTIGDLTNIMDSFVKDVAENKWQERGWAKSAYGTSKVGVSMLTRIFARDNTNPTVLINCCCPGWVRTDMAGQNATKSPDEGAITPVHLCFLPQGAPSGTFWSDKEQQSWM